MTGNQWQILTNNHMAKAKTILFAEDDQVLMEVYRKHLQRAGYHVVPALDGLETLKYLSIFVPDLLVLDLMMPKFDGEELLKFICTTPRLANLPLFILSSNSIIFADQEHLLQRAEKYLIKQSCTPAILLRAIQDQLTGPMEAASARTVVSSNDPAPNLAPAGLKLGSSY